MRFLPSTVTTTSHQISIVPRAGAEPQVQGKRLHNRSHKSENPMENATESPLDSSEIHWESDNPLGSTTDKWNYVGKYHWQSVGKCRWKSTVISEVSISGVQYPRPRLTHKRQSSHLQNPRGRKEPEERRARGKAILCPYRCSSIRSTGTCVVSYKQF